jgi:hypothetical protein
MRPYHGAMRWMRWGLIAISTTGLATVPTTASALVLAPPGHSGANQYVEVIPTSGGNAAPPGTVRGSGGNPSPHALMPFGQGARGDARLAKLGKDGQAAAALAASTAPVPAPAAERATPNASAAATAGGGSVASGLSHALGSSDTGGLGLLLPLLLATALLVALGIVAAGFRSRGRPAGPSGS